jgi:hypothetical protein
MATVGVVPSFGLVTFFLFRSRLLLGIDVVV